MEGEGDGVYLHPQGSVMIRARVGANISTLSDCAYDYEDVSSIAYGFIGVSRSNCQRIEDERVFKTGGCFSSDPTCFEMFRHFLTLK